MRRLRDQTELHKPLERATPRVDPTLPGEGGLLAFCTLLERSTRSARALLPAGRYNRGGMCGDVECGRCPLLADELNRVPDHSWVCSACTAGFKVHPYWKDGQCDVCDDRSIVLMLAVPQ